MNFRKITYLLWKKCFQALSKNILILKKSMGLLGDFKLGKGASINGSLWIRNYGKIRIGNGFRCNSGKHHNPIGGDTVCRLVVYQNGILSIGANTGISNSTIVCQESVTIGRGVLIGGGCRIWDTDFHSTQVDARLSSRDASVKTVPVIIGDQAFIGGGSFILKGVKIGANSIVAAGSVVTKSIPDNEIWGGNPAVFIRKTDPTSQPKQ
ncbi:MAG: acyltransferase [Candidatus Cloacimonetes bacterium]|nr:acyltransferase [Candidatus Cloacimonadota bacterium]